MKHSKLTLSKGSSVNKTQERQDEKKFIFKQAELCRKFIKEIKSPLVTIQ